MTTRPHPTEMDPADVFVVVTQDSAGVIKDLEVLDVPPGWDLGELNDEGLFQTVYVANVNGGDSARLDAASIPAAGADDKVCPNGCVDALTNKAERLRRVADGWERIVWVCDWCGDEFTNEEVTS